MINALTVLWDAAYGKNDFDVIDAALKSPAVRGVNQGIDCILKTQIVVNGKLTGWCAQHDKKTFAPVKARAFELVSLSGMETVGITDFLMKVETPSLQIKNAIKSAVLWLDDVKIKGYKYVDVDDASQPKGKDRVLVKDDASVVWARFYDIETGKPFFAGRDGAKKWNLNEIEIERRTGYAWYITTPQKLVNKTYPEWLRKNVSGASAYKKPILVAGDGSGDFTSIQQAINSLADSSATPRMIHIKPGIYHEKIFIAKHNIILEGEDKETTKIIQSIARDEWRCEHIDDWGVATLNLDGDDITLRNLTIANDYGFTQKEPRTVACAGDSTGKRTITRAGHQMALRTMNTTRLRAINCRFSAYAGDTVSPWNLADGMFYFKDCIMEGGVDFYCPRGWAWAENCSFYTNTGNATIWHDGSGNEDYKTVLKNCTFDGFAGFNLGRYHRDAQFYLIGCHFSKSMADKDIYQVSTANTLQWPRRVYYADCKRQGGDYGWFKNNLATAKGSPAVKDITVDWLFGDKWKPEKPL
jgi:pectinesterase